MVRYWMSLLLGVGAIVLPVSEVLAQSLIVPDGTLGNQSSDLPPALQSPNLSIITGGTGRENNLFHSFRDFNISAGSSAYFLIDGPVRNVLTRVTGSNASEILGRLGTYQIINNQPTPSNANFFLVNPHGVIFGPSSNLDIGGSVVVTTANALQFPNGELFSATVPTIPKSVLTVDPSALLYSAINAQNKGIVVRSAFSFTDNLIGTTTGLQVPNGKSLVLLGGNVQMTGGLLQAPGGRVDLGGLADVGIVGLMGNGKNLQLSFTSGATFANISLINNSRINTAAGGGGDIRINAQSLQILNGSGLFAGIEESLGNTGSKAGDIDIQAQGLIKISDSSVIGSIMLGTGKGGKITLIGRSVDIINGSQVSSVSLGQGNAGDVNIQADDVISLLGRADNGTPSAILTSVISGNLPDFSSLSGKGKGGDINLKARSIFLADGALALTSIVSLAAPITEESQGQSGNIRVNVSDSLFTRDGASFSTETFGQGDAGNIFIKAGNQVNFEGINTDGSRSGIRSKVSQSGSFNFTRSRRGGEIQVDARSLTVANGAVIDSSTSSQGNAGNIGINTVSLTVTNGAELASSTLGQGDAGNVSITVHDIATFDGVDPNGIASGAGSTVGPNAVGNGGTLTLETGSLTLLNGAQLTSSTFGQGNAGNLSITVRDSATLDGRGRNGGSSFVGSTVNSGAVGKGGTLNLSADSLTVTNGALLSTSSFGQGDAGNIVLRIRETLQMSNGNIETGSLQTSGSGIDIIAKSIRLFGNSNIITLVGSGIGNGGDIVLSANSILALNDSDILTFARGGRGGNITLNTRAFFGQNYRPAPPNTDPITLDRNDRVDINASGSLSSGTIVTPDTSFIQNSLNQLPRETIDTTKLLNNTCIVRKDKPEGTFYITGTGGLPNRPGDISPSQYPTNTIAQTATRPWQKGDPIVEPTGFYTLANGRLVMSRECPS